MAAKSTTTMRQVLSYQPHQAAWFAATQTLFNRHDGALNVNHFAERNPSGNPHVVQDLGEMLHHAQIRQRPAAFNQVLENQQRSDQPIAGS